MPQKIVTLILISLIMQCGVKKPPRSERVEEGPLSRFEK
jgi:hypothetical protein